MWNITRSMRYRVLDENLFRVFGLTPVMAISACKIPPAMSRLSPSPTTQFALV